MNVVSFDLCSNSILGSPLAIHSILSLLDNQLSGLASEDKVFCTTKLGHFS